MSETDVHVGGQLECLSTRCFAIRARGRKADSANFDETVVQCGVRTDHDAIDADAKLSVGCSDRLCRRGSAGLQFVKEAHGIPFVVVAVHSRWGVV